jgi:hypothetical protein
MAASAVPVADRALVGRFVAILWGRDHVGVGLESEVARPQAVVAKRELEGCARRVQGPNVGVALAEVVGGIGVIRPVEERLQTVVPRRAWGQPRDPGEGRTARSTLDG